MVNLVDIIAVALLYKLWTSRSLFNHITRTSFHRMLSQVLLAVVLIVNAWIDQ